MAILNAPFGRRQVANLTGAPPLIATIGSSTIARGDESNTAAGTNRTWAGVANAMNIVARGRAYCPQSYSRAVSGANSNDMLTQLSQVLALPVKPKGCLTIIGTNDVRSGVPWATTTANIETIINTLLDHGIAPIVGIPQPTLGDTSTIQSQMAYLADYTRGYVQRYKNCILVDPTASFIDRTLATYESLTGFMDNGIPRIHLNHLGTQIYGQAIAQALADSGWSPTGVSPKSNGELFSATYNTRGSLHANPMLAGTGGTTTAPATGSTPDGWTFSPTAVGGTVSITQATGAEITFSGTATAGGNALVLFRDLTAPELATIQAGDTLELVAEVDAGATTNVGAIQADLRTTISGTTYDDFDGGSISNAGPTLAFAGVLRPVPRLMTAAPTLVRPRLLIVPAAAGAWSGTVKWKSCIVRKTA